MNSLIAPKLLRHQDRNMTLLLTTYLRKITQITGPRVPYDDDEVISNIFHLFDTTFYGIYNINSSLVPHLEGG